MQADYRVSDRTGPRLDLAITVAGDTIEHSVPKRVLAGADDPSAELGTVVNRVAAEHADIPAVDVPDGGRVDVPTGSGGQA